MTQRRHDEIRPEKPADLNSQELQQRREKTMNIHVDLIQVPSTGWEEKKNCAWPPGTCRILLIPDPGGRLTKYAGRTINPMQD